MADFLQELPDSPNIENIAVDIGVGTQLILPAGSVRPATLGTETEVFTELLQMMGVIQ